MRITRNPKKEDRPSWTKDLTALEGGEDNAIYADIKDRNMLSSLISTLKKVDSGLVIKTSKVLDNKGKEVLKIWKPIN